MHYRKRRKRIVRFVLNLGQDRTSWKEGSNKEMKLVGNGWGSFGEYDRPWTLTLVSDHGSGTQKIWAPETCRGETGDLWEVDVCRRGPRPGTRPSSEGEEERVPGPQDPTTTDWPVSSFSPTDGSLRETSSRSPGHGPRRVGVRSQVQGCKSSL